jgi:hypothetical protein
MGLGGPVWHVSVQDQVGGATRKDLEDVALATLKGVGDASAGEWQEMPGRTFHLRRRLSADEAALVGPVIDVRGTVEAVRRLDAVSRWVVEAGMEEIAIEEMTHHA